MTRFGQQEEADLLHVRAGRHVDVVQRLLLVKAGPFREVVELLVDLLEVPGVLELDDVEDDIGLWRDACDIRLHPLGEVRVLLVEDEVQFVDWQLFLLDESDRGPPGVPPTRPAAAVCVFLCAKNGYDCCFHRLGIVGYFSGEAGSGAFGVSCRRNCSTGSARQCSDILSASVPR